MSSKNGLPDRAMLMRALASLVAEAARRGEGPLRQRWAIFVRLLRPRLMRIAAKKRLPPESAEDMIQDVLLVLLKRWEELRPRGAEAVLGLLHRMMHDQAVDEVRRLDRRRAVPLEASMSEPMDQRQSESVRQEELREWLTARLEALEEEKPTDAWLLREHYLAEQSAVDLAAELGCLAHAVECRISRALARLRRLVARNDGGELPL